MNSKFASIHYASAMLLITLLAALLLCVTSDSARNDCIFPKKTGNQADYYWRDYFGEVPSDAVAGGYTNTGNVTYIAQLPSQSFKGIYVGNIIPGKKEAVAAIGHKVTDGTYVKILCSNPSNKFEWISHLFTDYHMIIGGVEIVGNPQIVYIGRVNFENEVQVGRVFDSKSLVKGLWLYNKAGTQLQFNTFELLVLAR